MREPVVHSGVSVGASMWFAGGRICCHGAGDGGGYVCQAAAARPPVPIFLSERTITCGSGNGKRLHSRRPDRLPKPLIVFGIFIILYTEKAGMRITPARICFLFFMK